MREILTEVRKRKDILDNSKQAGKYVGYYVPNNTQSGQYVK